MLPLNPATNIFLLAFLVFFIASCANTKNSRQSISDANIYLQLGNRYIELNKLKAAKKNLESALKLDANNAEIYNSLGVLHTHLKQAKIAAKYYKKSIKLNPDSSNINNNYGDFLCKSNRYKAGMQLLKLALNTPLNNRKWLTLTNIGHCQLMQGQKKLAESSLRQALQIKDNYPPALFAMQKISYLQGNFMSARAFLERYFEVAKPNKQVLEIAIQTEKILGNKSLLTKYQKLLSARFPTIKND